MLSLLLIGMMLEVVALDLGADLMMMVMVDGCCWDHITIVQKIIYV